MTIPSRLNRRDAPRPNHAEACHAVLMLDDETPAPCEGREGHQGPHVARLTVTWEAARDGTVDPATARNGVPHDPS